MGQILVLEIDGALTGCLRDKTKGCQTLLSHMPSPVAGISFKKKP